MNLKTISGPVLFLVFLLSSCTRFEPSMFNPESGSSFVKNRGVFIINEGNYLQGNGSLSFYSLDSSLVYNNIFEDINNRPLGDIPFSMETDSDGQLFIVVNNSEKIEVLGSDDLKSRKTITELVSPRYILKINDSQAYVSSIYSDHIVKIDLKTETVSGDFLLGFTSEAMISFNGKAYIASRRLT